MQRRAPPAGVSLRPRDRHAEYLEHPGDRPPPAMPGRLTHATIEVKRRRGRDARIGSTTSLTL